LFAGINKLYIGLNRLGNKGSELGRKIKTSIALDEDLLTWIDGMIERKRFASRTHAIEYALQRLKEQETEELHITANTDLARATNQRV